MITWQCLLKRGTEKLKNAGIDDAEFDAEQLLLKVYGDTRSSFLLNRNMIVPDERVFDFYDLVEKRKNNVPLQYLLGEWDFYDSTFYVGEGVLIPRSETEELVDICSELIVRYNYQTVYDLCAGSGCIGLSLAKKFPGIKVYLFELYDAPLEYIRKNAEKLNLDNIQIIKLDILNSVVSDLPFADLIVSNPPYIETRELNSLQAEVLKEPVTALDGGDDGLMFYRAIADNWLSCLNPDGSIAFECGEEQSSLICNMLKKFGSARSVYDLYSVERFVVAEKLLKG